MAQRTLDTLAAHAAAIVTGAYISAKRYRVMTSKPQREQGIADPSMRAWRWIATRRRRRTARRVFAAVRVGVLQRLQPLRLESCGRALSGARLAWQPHQALPGCSGWATVHKNDHDREVISAS